MRRTLIGTIVMIAVLVVGAVLVAQEETKWLDPANCHFCQPLTETEGLLEAVGWENHNISNGIVTITTYAPEWEEAAKAAGAAMEKLWESYDPTAEHHLCGLCEAWLTVPMDKIVMEKVEFNGGELSITTTSDAEVLAQLHEMTDKTIAAMAALMEAEEAKVEEAEAEEGHEGHGH